MAEGLCSLPVREIRLSRLGLEGLRWIWGEFGGPRGWEGAMQAAAYPWNLSGAGDLVQAVLSHSPDPGYPWSKMRGW